MNSVEKILNFYVLATSLKDKIRSGWLRWNVSKERLESIAEHIYGVAILAIAIDSEEDLGINIDRVVKMLVLHELEEVIIGDITPFDKVTEEEKYNRGMEAVNTILDGLVKKDEYVSLLKEFNDRESKDAIFAYSCDKLEADLMSKIYTEGNYCDPNSKENESIMGDERISNLRKNGSKTLSDYFIDYDISKYSDIEIFKNIALYARNNNIRKN